MLCYIVRYDTVLANTTWFKLFDFGYGHMVEIQLSDWTRTTISAHAQFLSSLHPRVSCQWTQTGGYSDSIPFPKSCLLGEWLWRLCYFVIVFDWWVIVMIVNLNFIDLAIMKQTPAFMKGNINLLWVLKSRVCDLWFSYIVPHIFQICEIWILVLFTVILWSLPSLILVLSPFQYEGRFCNGSASSDWKNPAPHAGVSHAN